MDVPARALSFPASSHFGITSLHAGCFEQIRAIEVYVWGIVNDLKARRLMEPQMRTVQRTLALLIFLASLAGLTGAPVVAQSQTPNNYGPGELISAGHQFFGSVSR